MDCDRPPYSTGAAGLPKSVILPMRAFRGPPSLLSPDPDLDILGSDGAILAQDLASIQQDGLHGLCPSTETAGLALQCRVAQYGDSRTRRLLPLDW